VDLDVQERSLVLLHENPPRHSLRLALPYAINEAAGGAKFDKATRRLTVSLPIKGTAAAAAVTMTSVQKTERLSSNDSGIDLSESDNNSYRTTTIVGEGQATTAFVRGDSVDACTDKPSDSADGLLDHRTAVDDGEEKEEEDSIDDDFLEKSVTYSLPAFTSVVQPPVMSFTLEVKNVEPGSIVRRVWGEEGAVGVRFASLGSGLFPLHHAFVLRFQEPLGSLQDSDLEIGMWM
jgi:hypothetical protein